MVGDQIAQTAFENNWAGIITNGYIRDIEVIKNINIGIYAFNSFPKKLINQRELEKKTYQLK